MPRGLPREVSTHLGKAKESALLAVEVYNKPATRFVAGFIGAPPMNIFDATIDPSNPGVLQLLGTELSARGCLPQGVSGPLKVGIRPESIELSDKGLLTRIVGVENLGSVAHVHGECSGQRVIFAVPASQAQMLGTGPAHLVLDPARMHFFVEGQRLT